MSIVFAHQIHGRYEKLWSIITFKLIFYRKQLKATHPKQIPPHVNQNGQSIFFFDRLSFSHPDAQFLETRNCLFKARGNFRPKITNQRLYEGRYGVTSIT